MQIFVKLGLRTHESSDGPANRHVVLQTENWSFCSIGLLIMALAAGGVWSFDRSVWQPSLVVCTVWDQLFWVVSCSVVVEDFRTSLFSDCSLTKTMTSKKKSWCAALPTRKRKIKSIASSNWIDSRLLLHQVQKAILHATHQSPNVDQLNITEVQISKKKKCWQIQLNGKNQPNHRSEPAEPLDSPHESPISKRKICSRRRQSTRTFVWIFANMRHFFRTSSPSLYENCNFRFEKRPYSFRSSSWYVLCDLQIFSGSLDHIEQPHAQILFQFPKGFVCLCALLKNCLRFFNLCLGT